MKKKEMKKNNEVKKRIIDSKQTELTSNSMFVSCKFL